LVNTRRSQYVGSTSFLIAVDHTFVLGKLTFTILISVSTGVTKFYRECVIAGCQRLQSIVTETKLPASSKIMDDT
jgi:hypothetical protein